MAINFPRRYLNFFVDGDSRQIAADAQVAPSMHSDIAGAELYSQYSKPTNVPPQQTATAFGGAPQAGPTFTPVTFNATDQNAPPEESPYRSSLEAKSEDVISQMLSGGWTEGLRERQTEATNRAIMQSRGSMAQQLAQGGLTGQGIGTQAMQGVEQQGRQLVASNILESEIAEQAAKERGIVASINERVTDMAELESAMTEADRAITAGDYQSANHIITQAGQTPIDFSKLEAGDYTSVLSDIDGLITSLGDDAPPALISYLGGLKANVLKTKWSKMGVNVEGDLVDSEGNAVNLNTILESLNVPDEQVPAEVQASRLGLESNMTEWWTSSGRAEVVRNVLGGTEEGSTLLSGVESGDLNSIETMGRIVGAAFAQDSEYGLQNEGQRSLLQEYGLYDSASDITSLTPEAMDPIRTSMTNKIVSGDMAAAQQDWNALNDAQKKYFGNDFDAFVANASNAVKTDTNSAGNGIMNTGKSGLWLTSSDGTKLDGLNETLAVLRGADSGVDKNYVKYLLDTAPIATVTRGSGHNQINISGTQNSVAKIGDRLVWISEHKRKVNRPGVDYDVVTVTDLITGKSQTFSGTRRTRKPGLPSISGNLEVWLNSLTPETEQAE
jgi:hypothetical protein